VIKPNFGPDTVDQHAGVEPVRDLGKRISVRVFSQSFPGFFERVKERPGLRKGILKVLP
jgi:hypothetical protein